MNEQTGSTPLQENQGYIISAKDQLIIEALEAMQKLIARITFRYDNQQEKAELKQTYEKLKATIIELKENCKQ
jgi:hypothetical protein